MQADGAIKIDTRIDGKEFNKGLKQMESSAGESAEQITRTFDEQWKAMGWEEKQKVIAMAADKYGSMWDTMGPETQRIALQDILRTMSEMPAATDKTREKLDEAAESTKAASEATKKWNVHGHGLSRTIFAMIPGTYRIRRGVLGIHETLKDTEGMANRVKGALKVFGTVAAIAAVAIVLAFRALIKWAQKTIDSLANNLSVTSAFRDRVVQLKGAFDTLKGSIMSMSANLLSALAPVLMKIIDWLTKAVNWISMFVAALTGQKTVLRYVSGAVGDAADSTKKMEKAAKGALAAFDEINVLQQDTDDEDTATGGTVGGNIVMEEIPVPEDYLKSLWEGFVDWLKGLWSDFWEWFGSTKAGEWLIAMWKKVSDWAIESWDLIKMGWEISKVFWKDIADKIVLWFSTAWTNIISFFLGAWEKIKAAWGSASEWFRKTITDPVNSLFRRTGDAINGFFSNAWSSIKSIWIGAGTWFQTNIIDPIKNAFSIALSSIKTTWETTFTGIKNFVKGIINTIIDFLNGMIRGITTGINTAIRALNSIKITMPSWLGGGSFGLNIPSVSTPQIPRLATGAVIPPNAEFAAILGDQKSGRNIEAPEGLIRQIIQEEIGNIQTDVNIEFSGSLGALVRELQPYIKKENTRIGNSLVRSTT